MVKYSVLLFCIILVGCDASRIVKSAIKPEDINYVELSPPLSSIALIEKGNKAYYNDSVSHISENLIRNELRANSSVYKIRGEISLNKASDRMRFQKEAVSMISKIDSLKDVNAVPLSRYVDSLMEAHNSEYCLFIFASGYSRTSKNYWKNFAANAALSVATIAGGYVVTSTVGESDIYSIIFDSKNNNVAFYRKSKLKDYDPLESYTIKTQLESIFNGYFIKEKF